MEGGQGGQNEGDEVCLQMRPLQMSAVQGYLWVPIRVVDDDSVSSCEVDAEAARPR